MTTMTQNIAITTTDNGNTKIKSFETTKWFVQIVDEYYKDPATMKIVYGLKKPKGTATIGQIEMVMVDRLIVKYGFLKQDGTFDYSYKAKDPKTKQEITVLYTEDCVNEPEAIKLTKKCSLGMAIKNIRKMLELDEQIAEDSFQHSRV